jgi:Protein of unknown function (DUF3617)
MTLRALASATFTVLLASLISTSALAQDFPPRKPGLWEVNMIMDGVPPKLAKHCVDEKTDKQMQQMGQGMNPECKPGTQKRDGNTYLFEQECKFGNSVVATRSMTKGDFQSKFQTEIDSRFTPPINGKATSKTVLDAKWAGACPSGWKPGDMELPGGIRMNVNEVMQGAGKLPKK